MAVVNNCIKYFDNQISGKNFPISPDSMKIIFFLAVSAVFLACNKQNADFIINPLDGLTKMEEGYAIGASAKVEIWGERNFYVGYNKLAVVILDSLNLTDTITDAHIHFMPIMTMRMGDMDMQQATPFENPPEVAINGAFPGAVAFVMPSDSVDVWQLGVAVHNHKYGLEGEAVFDINVEKPVKSLLSVFPPLTSGNNILAITMIQPASLKVGVNEMEFVIFREVSMMEWQPDGSYVIEITPEMAGMGPGSTVKANPVNANTGHYRGKVNFSMSGQYKLNVVVKKSGVAVSQNLVFTITF